MLARHAPIFLRRAASSPPAERAVAVAVAATGPPPPRRPKWRLALGIPNGRPPPAASQPLFRVVAPHTIDTLDETATALVLFLLRRRAEAEGRSRCHRRCFVKDDNYF